MDELGRCFACSTTIRPGYEIKGRRRSGVPEWIDIELCIPCGNRIQLLGEVVVERDDEYWTVRPGAVMKEATNDVGRQRSS